MLISGQTHLGHGGDDGPGVPHEVDNPDLGVQYPGQQSRSPEADSLDDPGARLATHHAALRESFSLELKTFSLTHEKVSVLTFLIVLKLFLLSDCSMGQEQSNIPMILCLTRLALLGSLLITFSMALPSCLNFWCQKESENE